PAASTASRSVSSGRRIARGKVPGQVAAELVRAAAEPAAVPVALVALVALVAPAGEVGDR
ncbi:MAG: hypothetical protein L0I76_37010, partial [Pseudonocardia sp.]|nr:hypothetical protein [Pseudonocardia sp.]